MATVEIGAHCRLYKECALCGEQKYYRQFPTRRGRRSGAGSRKGCCRSCDRKRRKSPPAAEKSPLRAPAAPVVLNPATKPVRMETDTRFPVRKDVRRTALRPNKDGMVRMKGKSNNGKRWIQEIDWELARLLVEEHAAVIINPHLIRRLYSNDDFRRMIMERDRHTCYYCGGYGDTIDHILPKSKGGHTTPVNCVCSCYACNQSKADRDVNGFIQMQQETEA
ncbi:HNH endonuclease [Paenibacillus filicis]|uniref:HNH endonuclease n=1 Tax=Paenibacillus gyeongsangnamensis TaxID=3388067 RepID=A0ABT4QBB4_9BACL|nr:HNH endonuclease [Paenibacillus filicis]MCZ8514042.1 HNH endonuclease [Paenibacillus filicis]